MMETLFTTGPLTGFPFQPPLAFANRPVATPLFGPAIPGVAFGPPPAVIVGDTNGGVSAPALLAAVAMRRGQPQGPTSDHEVEDFIYDALELLPGAADVDVRCESGRATLTGSVQHKRAKRDVGEIAWAIPALIDVQNNVTIASRRRARGSTRDSEPSSSGPARKQRVRQSNAWERTFGRSALATRRAVSAQPRGRTRSGRRSRIAFSQSSPSPNRNDRPFSSCSIRSSDAGCSASTPLVGAAVGNNALTRDRA